MDPERFVDAAEAATFLSISRKHLLRLSRQGHVPAHPLGFGSRRTWRFLLSELRAYVLARRAVPLARTIPMNEDKMKVSSSRRGGK